MRNADKNVQKDETMGDLQIDAEISFAPAIVLSGCTVSHSHEYGELPHSWGSHAEALSTSSLNYPNGKVHPRNRPG